MKEITSNTALLSNNNSDSENYGLNQVAVDQEIPGYIQDWLQKTGLNWNHDITEMADINSYQEFDKLYSLPYAQQFIRWLAVDETLRKFLTFPLLCLWPRGASLPLNSDFAIKRVYTFSSFYNGIDSVITRVGLLLWLSLLGNDLYYYYRYPNQRFGTTLSAIFYTIFFTQSDNNELSLTSSLLRITVWPELLVLPLAWGIIKSIYRGYYRSKTINNISAIVNTLSDDHYHSNLCNDVLLWLLPWSPLRDRLETLRYALLWDNRLTTSQRLALYQSLEKFIERSNKLSQLEVIDILSELVYGISLNDYPRLAQDQRWELNADILASLLRIKTHALNKLRSMSELPLMKPSYWQGYIKPLFRYLMVNYYLWGLGQSKFHALHPVHFIFGSFKFMKIFLRWRFFSLLIEGIVKSIKEYQDEKNCEAQGKLWLYMNQVAAYVCSVCGDFPVFYSNIFTAKDCLNDFLSKPRPLNQIMTLLNRVQPSDNITELDFGSQTFSDQGNELTSILPVVKERMPQLLYLDLGPNLGPSSAWALGQFLNNSSLTNLALNEGNLANGTQFIAAALPYSQLEFLDLTADNIGIVGIQSLAIHLAHSNLRTLYLPFNNIEDLGAQVLGQGLMHSKLQQLVLIQCNITSFGTRELAMGIKNSTLLELDLSLNAIGNEGAQALADAMVNNSYLIYMNLQDTLLGDNGTKALAEKLADSNLQQLTLDDNPIGIEGAKALGEGIPGSNLKILSLSHNNLEPRGVWELAKGLRNSSLEQLYLSGLIGDLGAQGIGKWIENSTLLTLQLYGPGLHGIGPNGMQALGKGIAKSNLQWLGLSGNHIGDNVTKALVEELVNSRLQYLDLSHNDITTMGAEAIGKKLAYFQLQTLDLSFNNLGNLGARSIGRGLINSSIAVLYLRSTNIESEGAEAIGQGLRYSNLTILDLFSNNINDSGARALAQGLVHSNLKSLEIGQNKIGNAGAEAIAEILPFSNLFGLGLEENHIAFAGAQALGNGLKNSQLQVLGLNNNLIGDLGTEALTIGLPESQLTNLDLDDNHIGDKGAIAIASVLTTAPIPPSLWINILDDTARHVLAKANPNTNLAYLSLSYNPINLTGARALCEALPQTDINSFALRHTAIDPTDGNINVCQLFSSASSLKAPLLYQLIYQASEKICEAIESNMSFIIGLFMIYLLYKSLMFFARIISHRDLDNSNKQVTRNSNFILKNHQISSSGKNLGFFKSMHNANEDISEQKIINGSKIFI